MEGMESLGQIDEPFLTGALLRTSRRPSHWRHFHIGAEKLGKYATLAAIATKSLCEACLYYGQAVATGVKPVYLKHSRPEEMKSMENDMTNEHDEPEMERSELAGEFTEDDVTVLVDIYRPAGTQNDWTMEVITEEDDLTTWEEPFATDREAFEEFLATVERDGIRSFFGGEDPEPAVH
ncbi:hypothetical protein J2T09_001889 [Neorhizobium huautlense]|uniref:Uncharacterized protein n=2 Tax=Neorhizobium huautlense TaxID=67774 RepID=A0ABT9PRP3_9HYPH|nr:hypothetical protein [Neorhizobium huautlense]